MVRTEASDFCDQTGRPTPDAISLRIKTLTKERSEGDMLWTVFVVLLILWLLGFSLHVGGSLIHLLLVLGLVVLVINLLSGRQSAV